MSLLIANHQFLKRTPKPITLTKDFCGALGAAQASAKPFVIKNVFSKCTVNKPVLDSVLNPSSAIDSRVIISDAYYYALKDDANAVGYHFENLFGCVEHVDSATGEKTILTELYKLPEGHDFAQIHCRGCEVLPENHRLDTNVWNLNDLSDPRLQ